MNQFNTVEEAVIDLKNNKIIIVIDDKNRENEGDFICAGLNCTDENINFMSIYGRGLICTPIDETIAEKFNLEPMTRINTDNHQTNFSVSIDHYLTSTGISAKDRALTIRKLAEENTLVTEFRKPGHIFPLIAVKNGVLARKGHTEATVDLMKIANLKPVGVCCEIIDDDGKIMNLDNLMKFKDKHNLKIISVKDIEEYRKKHETLITLEAAPIIPTKYGLFKYYGFKNTFNNEHHLAIVKGDVKNAEKVLTRIHSECLTGDIFHSLKCDCGNQLIKTLELIQTNENGIILYMRQEGRGIGLLNKLKAYELQEKGLDTVEANEKLGFADDLREYFISAQMLKFLEVKSINLLSNNPAKITELKKYDIKINQSLPLITEINEYNKNYLLTKETKMNHILNIKEKK